MTPETTRAEPAAAALSSSCVHTLTAWLPPDPEQGRLRKQFLELLGGRPDAWSRSSAGIHLTASALVCAPAARQVLLTLHARIGRWLQTGGHLEASDGSLGAAAHREATEESGLTELALDPLPLLLSRHEVPCGSVRPTYHLDVQFLVRSAAVLPPRVSAESTDVRWFDLDGLPAVDSSVLALVAAAGRRLGW